MPQFDDQSIGRISRTVQGWERRLRNESARQPRFRNKRAPLVEFELLEALTQFSGDIVLAARKLWVPSLDDGNGGFVVDCDDTILVADFNKVGHTAGVGGFGMAQMRGRNNEPRWVGVILDLCCPGDEQGVCESESGSGS